MYMTNDFADPDRDGNPEDGIYLRDPDGTETIEAYCDMSHDDGGWTLLLSADGNSSYWGNTLSIGINLPLHSTPLQQHYQNLQEWIDILRYMSVYSDEIKLCNANMSRCFVFDHQQNVSFQDYFYRWADTC